MGSEQAEKIADALIRDIQSRKGIGDEWDAIDWAIKREIRATWVGLIVESATPV